jgi:uncharacterized protein (TIGR03790 family)
LPPALVISAAILLLFPTSAQIVGHAGFQSGEPVGGMLNAENGLSGRSLTESYAALVNYSDVLVIRNLNSADSMTIADYFASQRNISWAHVCNVTTSPNEQIDGATFTALANQVKSCINALPPSTAINFLVTTKGVPLGTWRSPWENSSSVDSELALVGGPYEFQIGRNRWFNNPYYDKFAPFTRARWGFYIVTRLTAFTVPEALGLVDKATEAIGHRGRFVLDVDPGKDGGGYQVGNDWMRDAAPILTSRGFNVTLDETYAFLTNYSGVAGYSSWGSNDGTWYTAVNTNSGFEADADSNGVPDGWFYDDAAGTANVSRNSSVFESGAWSLEIERPAADNNYTAVSENFSAVLGSRYFLTGSANYTGVAGRGLFLQIKALDSYDNVLAVVNGSAVSGTSTWRGFPQIIYEPVPGAMKLRVSVVFDQANGTAFVDNIRMIEIRPHNRWIPGSLAETAVSTGARSFVYGTGYGQSLVADLIRDGVTGVKGYVYEPYLNAIAHSDILYDAYTRGYTLGESYMMASFWGLSWMDAIMGDPKLAPYNRSYLPDLTLSPDDIVFSNPRPNPGETIDIDAAVHNVGHFPAVNATVSFYLGDPRLGGTLLGSDLTTVLDGASAAVSLRFNTTGLNGWYDICVVVDPDNNTIEVNENNNQACAQIAILPPMPDLSITPSDLQLSPPPPYSESALVTVNATIHNIGMLASSATVVRFQDGLPPSPQIGSDQALDPIPADSSQNVSVSWTASPPGDHEICVIVDPDNLVAEIDKTNNIACIKVSVASSYTVHLTPGHRFMSFPLLPANVSIESVLSSVAGCFDYVRYYDALDPVSPWKVFMPGRNSNSLLRLDNSMGFWINVTAACDLTVIGVRPDVTVIRLLPGWNMVGFPSMNASYAIADLKAALGMPSVSVEAFDAMAAPYYLRRVPDSYTMMAGEGYWIFVPSAVSWNVPG